MRSMDPSRRKSSQKIIICFKEPREENREGTVEKTEGINDRKMRKTRERRKVVEIGRRKGREEERKIERQAESQTDIHTQKEIQRLAAPADTDLKNFDHCNVDFLDR